MRSHREVEIMLGRLQAARNNLINEKYKVAARGGDADALDVFNNELERNEVYMTALRWALGAGEQ